MEDRSPALLRACSPESKTSTCGSFTPGRTAEMSDTIDLCRRRFFGTAAMGLAAAQLALSGSVEAQPGKAKAAELRKIKPGTNTSFASLKQIDAGVLNVGYAEAGPADGPPAPPTVPRSFFCMAGPTTFIVMSMSRRCWHRRDIASSSPICAATARHTF